MNSVLLRKAYRDCISRVKTGNYQFKFKDSEDTVDQAMSLFLAVYRTYPRNISDVDQLIGDYVFHIEPSDELSREEKNLLYASFSVAAFSFKY